MAKMTFDLDAWLRRIGHAGTREPTLATLRAVIAAHTATILYENIDVLLGRPPKLDLDSLQRKMIAEGRGGYCYEQNLLLRAGLRALGFAATGLIARVILTMEADAPRPATHMVLRVNLPDGPYLADVGFGHLTPTAPLALRPDVERMTPHEPMRLLPVDNDLVLQARIGEAWQNLWRVLPHPAQDADYEVANWFAATHPNSMFANNLIAARPGPGGVRNTFLNGRVSVRRPDGQMDRRMLSDDAEFAQVLAGTFGLASPAEDLGAALDALDRKGARGATHRFFA
jgi:N-hydroxyarylamine O-acetyltransferase